MQNGLTHHFILITRNIRDRPFVDQIEHKRNIEFTLRLGLIPGNQTANVLRKRNAEFCCLGLRTPLGIGIEGDLRSNIHVPSCHHLPEETSCALAYSAASLFPLPLPCAPRPAPRLPNNSRKYCPV